MGPEIVSRPTLGGFVIALFFLTAVGRVILDKRIRRIDIAEYRTEAAYRCRDAGARDLEYDLNLTGEARLNPLDPF